MMAVWLMLGTAFLAGCQNDALSVIETDGDTGEAVGTECYINLHITDHSPGTTRATEAEESAIYDGILAIFEGTDAATATLKTAVVIDQLINNPGSSVSIDVTQRLAIGTHPYNSNLYLLALLNTTATGFTVGGNNNNELCFNGVSKTGSAMSQIQAIDINSVGSTDEHVGLFMTNSNGLVEAQALFDTEEAARDGSALRVTIPVERAAARLRVANGIGSNVLTAVKLNDDNNSHPAVHHISWALASEATGGFALYQQQSHQSGDAVYIPASTDPTGIIVEVQLKDGSFLVDDCYKFAYSDYLYTSASQFVAYLKSGWTWQKDGYGLGNRTADEIYGYVQMEMAGDGTVTFAFTMDTSNYSNTEKAGLDRLANELKDWTTGYRHGKMYYTYYINTIERNNAYNLTLTPSSITAIGRPAP